MLFSASKSRILSPTNVPLRRLLVGTFVLPTAAAIGLTSWLSLRNGEQAVNEVAQYWQQETVKRIQLQLKDYLDTPNLINQINARSLRIGELSLQNPESLTQRFWHQKNLFNTASVSAIYVGSIKGDFIGLGFQSSSLQEKTNWQASRVDSTTQRRFHSYALDAEGKPGALLQRGKPYDPRTRPWYQTAIQARKPGWSPIYADFTEKRFKITFSQPVYDAQQSLLGVVGTDFVLSHLGGFLRSLNTDNKGQISQDGRIYIMDREGKLIAISTQNSPFVQKNNQLQRIEASRFQDEITQQSAQTLIQSIGSLKTLRKTHFETGEFKKQRYFLQITPFSHSGGLDWLIVVAVPEAQFLQSIQTNTQITIWLCFLILLGSVLFGLVTSFLMVQAMRRIIQASQAIADGNLEQQLPGSSVQEVNALSQTFNRMTQQLKQSFEDLETRVQERTAALQQSEEKFAKVFYHHPNPIAITRATDATFVDVNDSALKATGFARFEVIGRTIADLKMGLTLDDRNTAIEIIQKIGAISDYESKITTKAGKSKTVLYSADLMQLGEEYFLISSFNDISDRKQTEEALKVAKKEAEAANLAKSQFLSTMSHELRTPLNAILGFSQLLSRDPALSGHQKESLDIINRSGEHLLVLINDVLDMAKIEAGRHELHITSIDLYNFLDSLENLFRLKSLSKKIQLQFKLSPTLPRHIKADETKLRQILQNLLGNALKFTQKGQITLQINDNLSQSRLTFVVKDTGFGIADHELPTIFESFVQTQTGRNSQTGTGLGLSICRKFVELMGGEITVQSKVGVGTQFSFFIQIEMPSEAEINQLNLPQFPQRVVGIAAHQTPKRILIADDRWEGRRLLTNLLSSIGFEVREATNGEEAICIYNDWHPHLIWMDMKMPVMDGYTATQYIKQREAEPKTIIIALTASALEEERDVFLAAGCDDFVRKPFQEAIIFQKIQEYLDVEYVYESIPSSLFIHPPHLDQELILDDLRQMPLDWVQKLHHAAGRVSNQDILQLIQNLPGEQSALAHKIRDLVQQFRCDKLFDLTEILLNEHRTQSTL
jgi:PAS domain S-box-containing protein